MTPTELRELEAKATTIDVETAGRPFGMGRAKSYRLARSGEFPVPVLRVGSRYRVRTSDLVAALLGPPGETTVAAPREGAATQVDPTGQEEPELSASLTRPGVRRQGLAL